MRFLMIPQLLAMISLASCAQTPLGIDSSQLTAPVATPAVKVGTIPLSPAPEIGATRAIVVDYASGRV